MYIVVCIIILSQRVVYKFHSILQVIIGSIIGLLLGYHGFYISQQNLMGIIREKPDDNAPI
jgi:membrane-associated phospholipid phosphatase